MRKPASEKRLRATQTESNFLRNDDDDVDDGRWGRDNGRWREEMRQFIYVKIFAQSTRSNKCYLDGEKERWDGKHEVEKAFNWHESFEAEITTRTVRCAYVNRHTHTHLVYLYLFLFHTYADAHSHTQPPLSISQWVVCANLFIKHFHMLLLKRICRLWDDGDANSNGIEQ